MRPSTTRGTASFPRSEKDLRSTEQCPACFTPLRTVVCHACGLNLAHPLASELATLSTTIAEQLDARLRLIDRIRREAVTPASPAAERPIPAPIEAEHSAPHALPVPPPEKSADTEQRRGRSGVQIALIIVGIALLSVFAVFGVVYAFITFGVAVRTLLIAAATAGTMVAASVLYRRGLSATAEGLAALGTVVLVLDAWALRRSDVAGLAALPERGYWGVALIVIAVLAGAWALWGGHRSPLFAGAVVAPMGAGLLAAETASAGLAGAESVAGAIAASGAALIVLVVATRGQAADSPIILRTVASVSSLASIPLTGFVVLGGVDELARESWQWAALGGAAFATIAALAAALTARRVFSQTVATAAASVLAVTASLGAIASAILVADAAGTDTVVLIVAVLASVSVAAAMDGAQWRWRSARSRFPVIAGALSAAAASLFTVGAAIVTVLRSLVEALVRGVVTPAATVTADVMRAEPEVTTAVASLAVAAGVVAAAWALSGAHRSTTRLVSLAVATGLVATLSLSLTPTWWATMALGFVLAVGSTTVLALRPRRRMPSSSGARAVRAGLSVAAVGASLVTLTCAWTVDGGWWLGVLIAVTALTLGRVSTTSLAARAVAVAVTGLIVIAAAAPLADTVAIDPVALTIAVSAVVIVLGRLPGATALERLPVLTGALGIALILAVVDADADPTSAVADTLALIILVAALALIAVDRRPGIDRVMGLSALGIATALLAARGLVAALALMGDPAAFPIATEARAIAALSALAVLAAASTLAASVRDRRWIDGGVGLSAVFATGAALATDAEYLALLITGVIALATALSRDGLISSRSPRRFIGWLALVFATAALWRALVDNAVTQPEPFVLPLAAALVVIAILLGRTPYDGPAPFISGPSVIAGAGLAIAGLPLAALAPEGPAARGAVVGILAVALASLASIGRVRGRERWAGFRAVSLTIAVAVQITLATSVVTRAISEPFSALEPLAQLSSILVVMMLIGTAVVAWSSAPRADDNRVHSRLVTATSAAAAGTALIAAFALGIAVRVEPIELLTVPLALGLLLIGTLELDQRPAARSVPWLGPGLVVLLLPSLIDVSTNPNAWRIVALGTVATAVVIGGVVRRLQAPFLVGGVVLLIHALAQSWPLLALVGESVEWWLWLGIAGIGVVAVAAHYERRVQNVKNTIRRISELR